MRKIDIIKKEIDYYSKIYSPECKKTKELIKKLIEITKLNII